MEWEGLFFLFAPAAGFFLLAGVCIWVSVFVSWLALGGHGEK